MIARSKAYLLFCIIVSLQLFPHPIQSDLTSPIFEAPDFPSPEKPTTADINFHGYTEDQFFEVYLDPEDIVMETRIVTDINIRVACSINITWPDDNQTWEIIFPQPYDDASEYFIRRSYLEYYYCLQDENVQDPQYVGRNTYWIIGASFGSNDLLNFSLLLPTIHIDPVYAETDYSRATFKITISRLDACPRPYQNVYLSSAKIITFTNFDYVIINRTGGISENITLITEFQYHLVPAGSGSNTLYFSLNLGSIRNKTDYEFTLIILPIIIRNTFLDRWFLYFVVLPLGITVLAMLLHPYIWEWVFRRPQPRKPRNEDYLKKGLPLGLIISAIAIIVLYAINVAQGAII